MTLEDIEKEFKKLLRAHARLYREWEKQRFPDND
jgi:hypothetical protein